MRDRGWTASREELLQGTLLDWVYGTTKGNTVPRLGTFMDDTPDVDQDTLHGLVAALESRGLIQLNRGMGITASGAHLTAHGRTIVRQRQEPRSNVKERVAAAREALLDWFYEQKRVGTHFPITERLLDDPRGHFEGDPFTPHEVEHAAKHLSDRSLIKGAGNAGLLRAEITTDGEDVVENYDGSLTGCAASQRSGGSQFVTHFNGPVTGQVGIGEQVTQTQHQGFNVEAVLRLIDDARDAAADVAPAEQALVFTYLDVLQAEVSAPDPNPVMVKGTGDRLKAIAAKAGNAGLSASVSTLVTFLLKVLGIG
jgi:hypothetical protein